MHDATYSAVHKAGVVACPRPTFGVLCLVPTLCCASGRVLHLKIGDVGSSGDSRVWGLCDLGIALQSPLADGSRAWLLYMMYILCDQVGTRGRLRVRLCTRESQCALCVHYSCTCVSYCPSVCAKKVRMW